MIKYVLSNIFGKKKALPAEELRAGVPEPGVAAEAARRLSGIFGRSVRVRQVAAGSCNACEWECVALTNPLYDAQRFGVDFVASPRHADIVLLSGPVAIAMAEGLKKTYLATPEPRLVIACGDCARDGGVYKGSYAVTNGAHNVLPVDGYIPGCPPSPAEILTGILKIVESSIGR